MGILGLLRMVTVHADNIQGRGGRFFWQGLSENSISSIQKDLGGGSLQGNWFNGSDSDRYDAGDVAEVGYRITFRTLLTLCWQPEIKEKDTGLLEFLVTYQGLGRNKT